MQQEKEHRAQVEAEMEQALLNGEFQVYLQPKMNMITSKVYGAEALSRWIHPVDGIRTPDKFIEIFEDNGFIMKLDMYVLEEICKIKRRWHDTGMEFASIAISINMSRLHLLREGFVNELLAIVNKYQIDPAEIEIEITENMYLKDHTTLTTVVGRLQESGFSVSIDDFGSGYSALNMLKDIPVDTIKIDKEFLQLSTNSERGKKVIKNIIRLCKDLKFNVMVEGVETLEQAEILVSYGCEIAQGFYYSKPIHVEDFELYTRSHYIVSVDIVKFDFNETLKSDDERYEAEFVGEGCTYTQGISESIKAVHFPGGPHLENCISLPLDIMHNDSYSISMWMKVDKLTPWTAAIFAEYENGFFQFCPLSEHGQACFRIRDRRYVEGWFDSVTEPLETDKWYYVVIMYDREKGRASLYINGKCVGTCEEVETLYFMKRLFIGSDIYKNSFEGSICEVVFYDTALKPEDVERLFNSYTAMEDFNAF